MCRNAASFCNRHKGGKGVFICKNYRCLQKHRAEMNFVPSTEIFVFKREEGSLSFMYFKGSGAELGGGISRCGDTCLPIHFHYFILQFEFLNR